MKLSRKIAAAAAATALVAVPVAAHAATLNVTYDATGTSHVAKTDSDVWIKPTNLKVAVESADGSLTGHMPILPADTKFHILGFLPIKAQVNFDEAAPVAGKLNRVGTRSFITSEASYYIRLSDVLVGGIPTPVGSNCQTKVPVVIPANSPDGESFSITAGGKLAGTFTIGDFEGCGLTTPLINALVPGTGNTVDLDVTNGRLG